MFVRHVQMTARLDLLNDGDCVYLNQLNQTLAAGYVNARRRSLNLLSASDWSRR
jgi:hypothetical protein